MALIKRKSLKDIGLVDGKLKKCPNLFNCINSMHEGRHHKLPWKYEGEREQALKSLIKILNEQDGISIKVQQEDYLHAECYVKPVGFIDDIEFYLPKDKGIIHYRSASRIGTWDLGVNARRLSRIRRKLKKALPGVS